MHACTHTPHARMPHTHLQKYLNNTSDDGQLVEVHSSKNFNSLVKQFLNVAQQTAIQGATGETHSNESTADAMLLFAMNWQ